MTTQPIILHVARDARAQTIAARIVAELRSGNAVELHAIGERAAYVMLKALGYAQASHGLACRPHLALSGSRMEILIEARAI